MSYKTLTDPLPPVFAKSPERDVSSRSGSSERIIKAESARPTLSKPLEVKNERQLDMTNWTAVTWIWIIIVPIIVWCLLLFLMPTFVKANENGTSLDHRSMLLWTLVISLVIWILFFGFAKCKTC